MPKPVHRNATGAGQRDTAPTMTPDEAMDILSAYRQRAIARIIAGKATQAAQAVKPVSAAEESLQHE